MAIIIDCVLYIIGLLIINSFFGLPILIIAGVILIILNIRYHTNFLRKLMRTFHLANEVRMTAINTKLKITRENIQKANIEHDKEIKNSLTEKQYKQLIKDINDVSLK